MNTTPYTKGEWIADGCNVLCEDGTVAVVYDPFDSPHTTDTAKANAHLIAAAPEIYEALANIVQRLDKGLALGETLEMKPARRALAKAEGKE